jgi:hypothetical protein
MNLSDFFIAPVSNEKASPIQQPGRLSGKGFSKTLQPNRSDFRKSPLLPHSFARLQD